MSDLEDSGHSSLRHPPIVVIGASAGGLSSIETIVESLSEDCGFALVFVQHLSPDHRSHMVELLGRRTKMPIHVAKSGKPLEGGQVTLIPAGTLARIEDGAIHFGDVEQGPELLRPISYLLESLAEAPHLRAAVILSGSGTDGAKGLRSVHEGGGITIVQEPRSASFDGMPRAALATGAVDLEMTPVEIAEFLKNRTLGFLGPGKSKERVAGWKAVIGLIEKLGADTGITFRSYRQGSLLRRIERVIETDQLKSPQGLLKKVNDTPGYSLQIVEDMLIAVTSFFRDEFAWVAFDQLVVSNLVEACSAGQDVRIWCPGCATGQEPYSVAMAMAERLPPDEWSRVKIFGTDIHEPNLATAREGIYEARALEGLSAERQERFTISTERGRRQVIPEIRAMVTFSKHNLLRDSPLGNLDVISCRNMLIYFTRDAQEDIFARFHLGLKDGAVLFLGASEEPHSLRSGFKSMGNKTNLYRRHKDPTMLIPNISRDRISTPMTPVRVVPAARPAPDRVEVAYGALLDSMISRGVMLGEDGRILHIFGDFSQLVHLSGAPPYSLLKFLSHEAGGTLISVLAAAREDTGTWKEVFLDLGTIGDHDGVLIRIMSVHTPDMTPVYLLVLPVADDEELAVSTTELDGEETNVWLTRELKAAKASLRTLSKELGVRHEQLQTTNEELTSSNEELQSTNEEVLSVNEELRTVNDELQRRIAEEQRLAEDLNNLLRSTEIGVIFLNPDMRIRSFTPAATDLFRIRDLDIGRKIEEIRSDLEMSEILSMARRINAGATIVEHAVEIRDRSLLVRAHPYRSRHGAFDGFVITIVDVSQYKDMVDHD